MSSNNYSALKIHKLSKSKYEEVKNKEVLTAGNITLDGSKLDLEKNSIYVDKNNTDGHNTIYLTPEADPTDADVKLSSKFTITKDFGYYTLGGKAYKEVGDIGQSLHDFLQGAFANEDRTIFSTPPTCGLYMQDRTVETGTLVTPSASWSSDVAGTYKWGTYADGKADFSNKATGISYSDKTTITYDKSSFTVPDGDTTVTASASVTRSAVANHPCSNLGNDIYSDLASEYKDSKTITCTKTATFKGYRSIFYGPISVEPTQNNLTSAVIRDLTNGGEYNDSRSFEIKADGVDTYKTFIVAIPSDNNRDGITEVKSTDGMTVNMTSSYKKASFTVPVADASDGDNTKKAYKIYYWDDVAYIGGSTVHEFTLG